VREYVEHYHEEWPHHGLGNQLLSGEHRLDENSMASFKFEHGWAVY